MPATAGLSQGAHVKVNGAALTAALYDALVDVRVARDVTVASQFTLRFLDPEFKVVDSGQFTVGTLIDIELSDLSGTYTPVFSGEIVSIAVEQGAGERHELIVSGYDKSHRLGHKTNVKTFQNMSYADVIRQIASANGLSPRIDDSLSSPRFEYLIQSTTDFAFLTDIALRTGCEWRVDGQALVVQPRPETAASGELTFGTDLRRFRARYSAAEHASGVSVRGWNPQTRQAVVAVETATLANPPGGSHPPLHDAQRKAAKSGFNGTLLTGTAGVTSRDEAVKVAKALGERVAAAEFTAKGEAVGRPDLTAGTLVTLKGLGTSLSGTYYLTGVEHVVGAGRPLITRFTVGGLEPSSLVDLLGAGVGATTPWGAVGVTVGMVTNNNDSGHPGQVKVKFPALSDQEESAWARVAGVGAGAGRGLMFMPEINDEVLVAFEQGDLRRPYVLTSLWHQPDSLPVNGYVENNQVTTGVIKTRTGHVLAFKDGAAPADRHFSVVLADGTTKLFVGQEKVELWASDNKPLQLKSGQATVTLKGQGDVEIKGLNITIDAQQALKINGLNVDLKANSMLKAEGAAGVQVKSTGPAKVESAAILELKGSLLKLN